MKTSIIFLLLSIFLSSCSSNTKGLITTKNSPQKSIEEMAREMIKEPTVLEKRRYTNFLNAAKYEKVGNYVAAFKHYKMAASDGYKPAYNEIGRLYYYGKGVKKNHSKAAHWLEKAATFHYDRVSLYNLGQIYRQGKGVNKDYSKALKFYRISATMYDDKAAKYGIRGYAPAQNNLAVMLENGMGVTRDIGEAKIFYKKAAKQGYQFAINSLKRLQTSGL